jgi:PAP2 superfamily
MNHPATDRDMASRKVSQFVRLARSAARNLHWAITIILVIGLIPAFHLARLPFRVNWEGFLSAYWMGLSVQSIFAATLVYVMGFPLRKTLIPLWGHYWRQKVRFLVLAIFACLMLWEFGGKVGLILIVDTVAFLEFFDRIEGDPAKLGRAARAIFIPAAYLFVGLVLVFCYNDVIASVEFVEKYSRTLNKIDTFLLAGMTVSQVAHAILAGASLWVYKTLEFIYFAVFSLVGGTLVIIALFSGKSRAFTYCGTLLTAYYLSLIFFFIWPAANPYMLCPGHFSHVPLSLSAYGTEELTALKARLLLAHTTPQVVGTDYYIAFPCMHIAMPMIALWFLRRWKRIVLLIAPYNIALFASILLLERHFFVDVIGGVLVAGLAIYMVDVCSRMPSIE